MPQSDDVLREVTFKGLGLPVGARIYRTLTAIESSRGKRTARALAQLIELLHKKRFLSDDQLDEFLYECVVGTGLG